jgi:hypothetical protein
LALYSAVFVALAAALIGSLLLSPMAGNMACTLVFPAIASVLSRKYVHIVVGL